MQRRLPTDEAQALIELTRDLTRGELAPHAADYEERAQFPRAQLDLLGTAGLFGLPYAEEYGGGAQPYEVYLQVLEEIAASWLTVAVSLSVHTLACHPLATYGTSEQRERWLPDLIGGDLLGAYCLSEPAFGSDAAALSTKATRTEAGWRIDGTKAWITHGGVADFYGVLARTGGPGAGGISCFLVPATTAGLRAATPERKMGMSASPTAQLHFDGVHVEADRLLGAEGQGFEIALAALDAGRLGIAACAVGLAQGALDVALAYAKERRQFGRALVEFQGLEWLLADMATSVQAARSLYLDAARRKDAGDPFAMYAAMAKLFATDMAMTVTTDAVQVLGGYGYVRDFPVERYLREAKVLQIVEGTNQVQRMVIGRHLRKG